MTKPGAKRGGGIKPLYIVLGLLAAGGLYWGLRPFLRRAPVIESISPTRSEPGQTVSIAGKGFDSTPAANVVTFGDRAATVGSASGEQLSVTIPDMPVPPRGDLQVVVERGGKKSQPFPFKLYRAPRVSELEPDVAMPGDEILVKGQNLDGNPLTVSIGGMAAEVREAVPASVRVVVPQLKAEQGQVVPVQVQIGPDSAQPANLTMGYLPLVSGVKPDKGSPGEKVVITGRGFDADAEDNEAYFGNQPALILSATETELTVVAPSPLAQAAQATAQIHVKANGAISSSKVNFTHLRPSATVFHLRFYAAAVLANAQFALVSTDLAPVMVLGGPETEVEATAARAVAVAAALNQLVEEAAAKPPVFEVRAQPETSVAVQGRDTPVVTVTAEDAAAYELPFEPGMKGKAAVGPRARRLLGRAPAGLLFALRAQAAACDRARPLFPRPGAFGDLLRRPADTRGHGRSPLGHPASFALHGPRPARDGAAPARPTRNRVSPWPSRVSGRAPWRKAARGRRASRPNSSRRTAPSGGRSPPSRARSPWTLPCVA